MNSVSAARAIYHNWKIEILSVLDAMIIKYFTIVEVVERNSFEGEPADRLAVAYSFEEAYFDMVAEQS